MPPQPNLAEEAAMQHSTARRINSSNAATTRQPSKASTAPRRSAGRARPATIVELRAELDRIQRDIQELTSDFEARVKPLTKAFEKAHTKLLELDPPPKKGKREPRSRYTEPRG